MRKKTNGAGRPAHPGMKKALRMVRRGSSLTEAARAIGVTVTAVSRACRQAGVDSPRVGRPRGPVPLGPEWRAVDWRKGDGEIARQLGLTRARVWQVRRQWDKPRPRKSGKSQKPA